MSKRAEQKAEEYEKSLDYYHYTSDNPSVAYQKGYEQAEKETIERACEWLEQALTHGCHPCSGSRLVIEFKQAMEGKEMTIGELGQKSMRDLWNLCYDNGITLGFDTGSERAGDVMEYMVEKLIEKLNEKSGEHTDR